MFSFKATPKRVLTLFLLGIILTIVTGSGSPAQAQDKNLYPRLQVLLPGEEAAPFTPEGKTGSPDAQSAGIPFQIRVRACNSDWETVAYVTSLVNVSSSDGAAEMPPNTPFNQGEVATWVTLNSLGDFTVTARDLSGNQDISGTSDMIRVEPATTFADHLEISSIAREQVAGQALVVSISARRDDGSLDSTQNGRVDLFQVTSLGQGSLSPEFVTLQNGTWQGAVTFYLADPQSGGEGSVRLNAAQTSGELQGWSNNFHVAPGAYDRLVAIVPGQNWTPWILEGLNGVPEQQWCDGSFPVDVYATDQYWNRVDTGDLVKLESGDAEADTPQFGPLIGGHRRFNVSLRTPGSWFLAVSDMDQPEIGGMVSQEIPVFYSHLQILLPGESPAPGTPSGRTGEPLPQVAGIPFPVKIRACNANFEPVPTDRVVVRLGTTDHTADLPAAAPMQNGELATELTFNSAGTFTISAEDITGPEYYTTTTEAVSVSGSTGVVAGFAIDQIGGYQTAGQPVTTTITAVDAQGDQVHTFNANLGLEQWTSWDTGSLDPVAVQMTGGQWTGPVTFHLADQSAGPGGQGSVRLHAFSQAEPAISGNSNLFQVAPGSPARLIMLLPGQSLIPATESGLTGIAATQATGQTFTTEIYATDQYWNRVTVQHTVHIDSDDPGASTPLQAILNGGHASVPLTFGSVGNWTLTVSDLTDSSVLPMTTIPLSVLSNTPDFVIEAVESPVTAGQPVTVTIRTMTPENQVMESFNGFAMLAADSGPQTVEPSGIQFTNGQWQGQVTFYGAAPNMAFSCIDFASPPNIGTSEPFTVLPGDFAGLQVLLPGQENVGGRDPGHSGRPEEQEAGVPFPLIIQAVDSWWNPVPGVDPAIELDLTDPFALTPESNRLTDGRLEINPTFLRAGRHTVSVACDSVEVDGYTSVEFDVRPGPYARLLALAPGEELLAGSELGKAGLAVDQSISYAFNMRALATDNWWNPVIGVNDLIELVCTDGLAELPQTFSLDNGEATVGIRLATAGYQLMTLNNLTHPEIPAAHTQMRAIESGFHIEAEIHPEEVIAGQPFTLSVRVVNDAGAVMQDINGFVEVQAINATTQEPGEGELLTGSFQFLQGVRSISQTYTRSEPIILIVTSPLGEAPGMTNVLNVVPGQPASLDFFETSSWVAGRHTTDINAKVADALGNGVPEVAVEFQMTGGIGLLEVLNSVTDLEGLAHARFTGASQAGAGIIQITSPGFSASMEILTSLMDPGSSGGTISNYPNPFHPGDGGTTVTYMLSQDARVTMRLFTLSGTLVFERTYAAGQMGGLQGINEVNWDGMNGENQYVASGGYILYVEAERLGETIHKMRRRIGVVR